jgi:hypothetical protein
VFQQTLNKSELFCRYPSVFTASVLTILGQNLSTFKKNTMWPGSSVGIATVYRLDGPGIESRWRASFSAPVHTGPGAHPASCTMGTGSFPGVESGRGVKLTPHPLLVPRSVNRIELYLYSPQGPSWPMKTV